MRSRTSVLCCAAGAVTAAALLAVSVSSADAAAARYRIGTGVSAVKGPHKPTPSPTPTTSTAPTPTTSSPEPSPTDSTTTSSPEPSPTDSTTTSSPEPSPTDTTTSTETPSGSDCGGTVLLKPDGSAWVCTFDDEFDGTSLDRSKWLVQTDLPTRTGHSTECLVDNPNNVAVADGTLRLTVRKEAAPFTCAAASGSYSSQYTSGSVTSYTKFSQAYGRFEVRAKLPDTTIPGLQETLWLWPDNATKYGGWPLSGEIDFGEFYSRYAGWNIPFIHYSYLQSTVSWLTNTNVYTALPAPSNQPGMTCSYDRAAFNTYTVVWAPGRIALQVNGQNCIIDNYSAVGLTGAAPFDQPFFLALTQALGVGGNAYVDGVTPLPATTALDYVRVWS